MQKTILITGSTDGIGLETSKALAAQGHRILLHGRSAKKLEAARTAVLTTSPESTVDVFKADLSKFSDVVDLAEAVASKYPVLDVIINNAGIFKTSNTVTEDGLDVRFMVNTIAPYLLTNKLLPMMTADSRVVNLSSAAQAPVSISALKGESAIRDDFSAYAQSKLAITIWTMTMAERLGTGGPTVVAVNPGSLLGTKMVKSGFGTAGNDVQIGVDILCRAALSDDFIGRSGQYFDNDARRFAPPHPDASYPEKRETVVSTVETLISKFT